MRIGNRYRFEDDMDAELRFHIECYVADLIRSGMSPDEAERRARIEFGSVQAKKEECRDAWGLHYVDALRADLRLAFRSIRRNPGFAAVAIVSLALGIGASTAIFGVIDAVILRFLPLHDPKQLVFVRVSGTVGSDGPPYPYFELIRRRATSFEAVAAFSPSAMELATSQGRELVRGVWVSGNFYDTLGVRPLIGRTLTASDDRPGAGGAAVISQAFWRQRFGGDPLVIGKTIQMFQYSVVIVGVMPTDVMSLEPGRPIDIAVPMALSDPAKMRDRTSLWLEVAGRLKPGITADQARSECDGLFHAYIAGVQISDQVRQMLFQPIAITPAGRGLGGLRRQYSNALTVLMILAGFVLIAACVNTMNLTLAKATARHGDFAVRLAIGASPGRLMRQTLTEALVLVGAGAALGVGLAYIGENALAAFFAERNDVLLDMSLNSRMALFSVSIALLSGIAVGMLPAVRAAQVDPATGLRGWSRGLTGNQRTVRLGRALVAIQVAVSVVLVAGAGVFIRSLRALESVDLGFRTEGILTMEVTPERQLFGNPKWIASQNDVLAEVQHLPGVRSAGWATMNPMTGRDRGAVVAVPGFIARVETDKHIHLAAVSPDYFDALGLRIPFGRAFTRGDDEGSRRVAILNESATHFYFGQANPIGRTIELTNYPRHDLLYEIVGVVKDAKHDTLREAPARFVYLPIAQHPDRIGRLAMAIRCSGDPMTLATTIREQIRRADSTLLITNVSTMKNQVDKSLTRERLIAGLSSTFGIVALVLACIGLYGILAYTVTRRTNEIGIRMALGATRTAIVWQIEREALGVTAAGIVLGVPIVFALRGVTQTLIYGIQPVDPLAVAGAAVLLLLFGAAAAAGPSRAASSLDPTSALRRE